MKRIVVLLCLMLISFSYVAAQNVVTGTVTDRDGNPIPGVKVELLGTAESVITELDGTFAIPNESQARKVRVVYSGMQTKVVTVTPDMVIRMSKTNWWNRVPEKYSWIVSPQVAFPESGTSNPAIGLMVARVKEWGFYAKGVYSPSEKTDGDYDTSREVLPWTIGKDKRSYMAVVAGAMYRLKCPVHVYAGVGYVDRKVAWQLANETFVKNTDYSYSGVVADYGLMLRCGHFSLNAGAMMSLSDGCNFAANVGIGVSF